MSFCKICRSVVSNGARLSDGGTYHENCLKSKESEKLKIVSEIHEQQIRLDRFKNELKKRESFFFKIASFIFKDDADVSALNEQIRNCRKNIEHKNIDLKQITTEIDSIYDYLFEYPFDWVQRKKEVEKRDGKKCKKCKRNWNLHLHHKIPLSKGGSNAIFNLQLLCENCHSKSHGGRDFSSDVSKNAEPEISKRLKIIENAINKDILITFDYKKLRDRKHTKRTIKPAKIKGVNHQRDSNSTLCVHGFCYLRKDERTFALKRMRALKLCDSPREIINTGKRTSKKPKVLKRKTNTNNSVTLKQNKKPKVLKRKVYTKNSVTLKKNKKKPKSQLDDMYEQLEEHDKENRRMMGYGDNEF